MTHKRCTAKVHLKTLGYDLIVQYVIEITVEVIEVERELSCLKYHN